MKDPLSIWDSEDAWFDGDKLIHRTTQDVEPILDRNKAMQTAGDGYSPTREMRRVASIPVAVAYQWLQEGVDFRDENCADEIRRRLNSPEWRHLRTAPGRV